MDIHVYFLLTLSGVCTYWRRVFYLNLVVFKEKLKGCPFPVQEPKARRDSNSFTSEGSWFKSLHLTARSAGVDDDPL